MQSLKSERAKKEYEQFVKEVTPKQNLFCNMAKAFIVGGLICVVGQILLHIGKTQFSLSKDDAGSWCSLILILSSVILTGLNIYQKIVTFAGCGALVPITGFANSVAGSDVKKMSQEIEKVDGVKWVLGLDNLVGSGVPADMLPESVTGMLKNDKYQLLMVNSTYKVATDKVNKQIEQIDKIMDKYDKGAMLVGEGPLTKDLINITDTDFKRVSAVSIGIVFVIILLLFKSVTIPVILVGVIEFAIFVNMGIPFYTGTKLPFVASIVIGTIQLGATVDYAILMTTRYQRERSRGAGKFDAITTAHKFSAQSIIVSALSFFAATIGVGLYSNIDMISSLCILMARGALISMVVVVLILPSLFMVFDKIIVKTSKGFRPSGLKS